jgi:hypothetical protein
MGLNLILMGRESFFLFFVTKQTKFYRYLHIRP